MVCMGGLAAGLAAFWRGLRAKFAPYTSGSGIPQVIASLSLPYGAQKTRLIRLGETFFKIPLTFFGHDFGGVDRQGRTVCTSGRGGDERLGRVV